MNNKISKSIERHGKYFNSYLRNLLKLNLPDNALTKVILYGTINGGKRIRPFLVSVFS